METERKEHFVNGLTAWLRTGGGSDHTLWIDQQVAVGLMTEDEAEEFEEWLGDDR